MNIWIILFFILIVIEAIIGDFTALSISIGAIFGIILAYFSFDISYQIIVFSLISFLSVFFMKPILRRKLIPQEKHFTHKSFIGEKALVIDEINNESKGRVKINGEIWYAKSYSTIKNDEFVIIQDIEDNVLTVISENDIIGGK